MGKFIEILKILMKYGNPEHPFHCEHDVLYIDISPELVSDEDKKTLDDMGVFPDEENGEGFISYKYGSC